MFGASVGLPSLRCRSRHRHFRAIPPSIAASLDPVVDVPVASSSAGELQSRLNMFTHRCSSSAVRGYSSLSIMFLSKVSAMSCSAWGSIHVVTNVARLSRALPSSISSSRTYWYAVSGAISRSGMVWRGARSASPGRAYIGLSTSGVRSSTSLRWRAKGSSFRRTLVQVRPGSSRSSPTAPSASARVGDSRRDPWVSSPAGSRRRRRLSSP